MSDSGDALTRLDAAVQQFGAEEHSLREYLEQLSDRLTSTCSRADIRCSGKTLRLEECGDEWVFGHLFCNEYGLQVASAFSGDRMSMGPDEELDYSVTPVQKCPVAWLRAICKREVIEAFVAQMQEALLQRTDELRTRLLDLAKVALPPDKVAASDFQQLAGELGFERLAGEWRAAQVKTITDPETATRTACTLVESVCKHILESKGGTTDGDLTVLLKNTRKALRLDQEADLDEPLQRVMSGMGNAVHAIGTFRNRASDAHGRGITRFEVSSAHARFVVNASGAIVTFLLERWKTVKAMPPA